MSASSTKASTTSRSDDEYSTASMSDEKRSTNFWHDLLRPSIVERSMVAVDALLIVVCGVASAASYLWYNSARFAEIDVYAAASALVALNFVLLVTVQRGYRLKSIAQSSGQLRIVLQTWVAVFSVLLAVGFTMKISKEFSRGATLLFFFSGLFALMAWKATASALISHALKSGAFTNSRIMVIAEQGMIGSSIPLRELRQHGYRPARILEIPTTDLSSPLLMSSIRNRLQELIEFARENKIEHVFLLLSWNRQHAIDCILDALKMLPIPVHLVPDANVARFLQYPVGDTGGSWTAELRRAPLSKSEQRLKRLFDLAGASVALLTFAPIMLAAAISIKCESRGPVLFRQTRNGFNGRAFRIYKFRSMRVADDGPNIVQATKNDVRVTRIGRWIRKTSIDELPQLLNVLLGDMSLVGPRPHATAHNSQYEQIISNYAFRHHVKPGITGWAQSNGFRGETKAVGLMERRVELDLWYINNWSIWLDVRIILMTAMISFRRSSAY